MENAGFFASALGLTLALSGGVALSMRRPLYTVLQEICGTNIGAQFWTRYASLMIVVGPLFLVSAMVKDTGDITTFLRSTVAIAAFGIICAFIVMGWAVGSSITPKTTKREG